MKTLLFVSYNELHVTWGGIHRVNYVLMTGLTKVGYRCLYLINKEGRFFYVNNKESDENLIDRKELRDYIIKEHVEVIIDQEGIFTSSFNTVFRNLNIPQIKLFTVFHNTPSIYEKLYNYKWLLSEFYEGKLLSYKVAHLIRLVFYPLWRNKTKRNSVKQFTDIYNSSKCCVMLSKNDISTLKRYVKGLDERKCVAIPNALTFDTILPESVVNNKEKIVLVVARLNDNEKRIRAALKIWRIVCDRGYKDWQLIIVGTGPHEEKIKSLSKKLKFKNVRFEGRKESEPYYEKAALFMMTSAVEGWGLTLTESMQTGTVPLAFNSYPALSDIITDGYDGCVVPDNDLVAYANRMEILMKDDNERKRIALNGLESCKRFAVENIINKWIELIENF